MKKWVFGFGAIALALGAWFAADWLALFKKDIKPGEGTVKLVEGVTTTMVTTTPQNVSYRVEEFVSGLNVPWSIVFTSDTRMLVSERPGRIRVVENGKLLPNPLYTFTNVSTRSEEGLMGLAVDLSYQENKLIYACYAYERGDELWDKVVQLRDEGDKLTHEKIIIDNIPAAQYHAGCRIAFGPDGKLYITTGDATDRQIAQNTDSLGGKILRINSDGSIPEDNPIKGNALWSYGHRNSQGIDWHPETGELYSSEHGPSVFDGPAGGDEVNHIVKGSNYGWPLVSHEKRKEGTAPPLIVFTPAEAPASLLVYSGKALPQFKNNLFFGALKGAGIMRLVLDESSPDKITSYEKLKEVRFGRIRDVVEGPDGFIYFSTSNRDGRGASAPTDDRIFRIRPQN